jgi:DNA-binding response OmpR family regulator
MPSELLERATAAGRSGHYLPQTLPPTDAVLTSPESVDGEDATMAAVLVIDDEPDIRRFLSRALVGHGFFVDCAPDGSSGVALAKTGRYQLVVLDLLLPDEHGVSVLKAITAARPEQAVIVVSALSDVESKVRCLELGANDYLTKPFALAELMARVRARMRETAAPPPERFLRVGAVTLDLQRHVAEVDGRHISLPLREFQLLSFLMRRAGTVCSRRQLLAEVWSCPFDPGTNVVDGCVRRLRHKLGHDVIETLRNVGYAFRLT